MNLASLENFSLEKFNINKCGWNTEKPVSRNPS